MKREIKKQLAEIRDLAGAMPEIITTEELDKLKKFYGVKKLKQVYQALQLDIDSSRIKDVLKCLVPVILFMFFSLFTQAQERKQKEAKLPLLELDTTAKKMYLHTNDNQHIQMFRDTTIVTKQLNDGRKDTAMILSKYYVLRTDKNGEQYKWYGVFQHTPELITFNHKY